MSDLHFRAAETVGVDFPKRIIEMIVTPWEKEAVVHDRGPSPITEIFSRGAFDGIQTRPGRVKVNRDHNRERSIGSALSFYPSRPEGLVAEVHISKTPLGDETLQLAEDGVLDVSAAYRTMDGGEKWESRSRVRITKAWLGHIALVPEPAYEDAKVLAVRAAAENVVRMPNRERLEVEDLRQLAAILDARYGVATR